MHITQVMDILFDIGNVIIGVDFAPSLSQLIPAHVNDASERLDTLLDRKDDFEAGRIPPEEYFPWAARTLGHDGSAQEFQRAWVDIFKPNKPMWDCIRELCGQGHRLILFSNINNPHKEYLLEKYPVFSCFTGGIFSYQTGHIKPESEIYQLAIQQYNLTPGNTLYIDDLSANIVAGNRVGFRCHQYEISRHDEFLDWLAGEL